MSVVGALALVGAVSAPASAAVGEPVAKSGLELLVNTTTAGDQYFPSVASLDDGRLVVAWTDTSASSGDRSGSAVRAQMIGVDGGAIGTEFLVNTTTDGGQIYPAVAPLADGGFVIAWIDASPAGESNRVSAQRYAANGLAVGGETAVSRKLTSSQLSPSAVGLAAGGFVITWTGDNADAQGSTSEWDVRARAFGSTGEPLTDEFIANTTRDARQTRPSVGALAEGGFTIAWSDGSLTGSDTTGSAIRAQSFSSLAVPSGAEFLVNSTTAGSQSRPNVVGLDDGGTVIVWEDSSATGADTAGVAVRGQRYAPGGIAEGSEFVVNTVTVGNQQKPRAAAIGGGGFVVAYEDSSVTPPETQFLGIRAQLFDGTGNTSGAEFLVNTSTADNQQQPSVAALTPTRFAVVWTDESHTAADTSATGIRAQMFDVDAVAPVAVAATVVGSGLTVDFDEQLDDTAAVAPAAFEVSVNAQPRSVTAVEIRDRSVVLTLDSAVLADEVVTVRYLAPTDDAVALRDSAGNPVASFSELAVTNGTAAGPADPAPTDPAPVDPAPVDPAPVDPAPVDPAPADPAAADPDDAEQGAAARSDQDARLAATGVSGAGPLALLGFLLLGGGAVLYSASRRRSTVGSP